MIGNMTGKLGFIFDEDIFFSNQISPLSEILLLIYPSTSLHPTRSCNTGVSHGKVQNMKG